MNLAVASPIVVTGAAGFIGYHTASRLLQMGRRVVGIDNVNSYYSPQLKRDRLAELARQPGFSFHELDLADASGIAALVKSHEPDSVIHLAAQAGVRMSVSSAAASAVASRAGTSRPFTPCRTISRQPGTSVETSGRPAAAASSKAFGMPSR